MEIVGKEKISEYIKEHKEPVTVAVILIMCFLLYFFALDNYPVLDPYESKFVSIARSMFNSGDSVVLSLNGNFFFETPPLYFWIESFFFNILGKISEGIARIPVALCATFGVFLVYAICRKVVARKNAIVASSILATSFMYIILAKIAVTDMMFCLLMGVSVYAGICTLLYSESYKKYFWWIFYIFAAFCLMAKGFIGILVPFITVFLCCLLTGKIKEMFKPVFLFPGLMFFVIIVFPWHWIMFSQYNPMFFNEYILKQHVDKYWYLFANGEPAPWYYIFLAFIGAFMPWFLSFVAQILVFIKEKITQIGKYFTELESLNFPQKFLFYNVIYFAVVICVFSFLATKHPVYVLPALVPASVILSKFWVDYFEEDKHGIAVNITMGLWTVLTIAGIAGVFFMPDFFKGQVKQELMHIQPEILLLLLVVLTMQIFAYIRKAKKVLFSSLIVMMTGFSMLMSVGGFNAICAKGQYDIVLYSIIAEKEGVPLATYNLQNNYSVLYYYGKDLITFSEKQFPDLLSLSESYPESRIILPNNTLKELSEEYDFITVGEGLKYSMIKNVKPKED